MQQGDKLPDFELETTTGEVRASDFSGQNLVLYFYPKDDTPGCTTESKEFSALQEEFKALNTTVLGVSKDSVAKHQKFREKYAFAHDLIADPDEILCQLFDVIKEKNMYGKKYLGIERSTFLFDSQSRLQQKWRKVKVENHVAEVLDAVKNLPATS